MQSVPRPSRKGAMEDIFSLLHSHLQFMTPTANRKEKELGDAVTESTLQGTEQSGGGPGRDLGGDDGRGMQGQGDNREQLSLQTSGDSDKRKQVRTGKCGRVS